MAQSLLRLGSRRALLTSRAVQLTPVAGYHAREKVGNRDIVGFGHNGEPTYEDRPDYPCPAVRFHENSADVLTMREREKGGWKELSLDDKRAIYRASFCQTFSEMQARNTGEWKSVAAGTLLGITLALWLTIWMKKFVYEEMPTSATSDVWKEKSLKRVIDQQQGIIEGLASNWDYEKKQWKE
ncbi:PREDICTED: cytochrome c oxidase subunit 4 isoform 1, mitochondrial-like [Priapulus caudatus]|uniref:Cytochrome c oxidase subunit 4 n=1 Tax=Priapulus caudatus TaxID=37621 RepID=A0ABM1F5X1_PRICU|nr:PREDICTED: cytochrome c oxidase subunit 4 isoform 1, mitochondrial-like [Priapulus caudatus]